MHRGFPREHLPVLRDHELFDDFAGPRNLVRLAQYEMHPLDTEDRA